jgi:hypothetical protein
MYLATIPVYIPENKEVENKVDGFDELENFFE